jgi:glycosyltransferase involved in cell wall biosynthesis
MRVTVIAANEKRDRHKFIYKPLLATSHVASLLLTRPFSRYLGGLISFFFEQKPDIVIFMGVGVKELIAYSFIRAMKIPYIVRLGGDRIKDLDMVASSQLSSHKYLHWLKYKVEKIVAKYILSRSKTVIVVNQVLGDKVKHQLNPQSRYFVVPQFLDGEAIVRDYKLHKPLEILTVTNLRFSDKAEGVIWLISRLDEYVKSTREKVRFRVAGDGQHFNDLRNFINHAKISDFLEIELLGYVTDLQEHYSLADIFIYRSHHDATPNVILESKRYGLPLLVNQYDEFLALVDNNVNGIIYVSEQEFQENLKKIISDLDFRKEIGMQARKDYKSRFSIEAVRSQLENVLSEVGRLNS